MAHPLLDCLHDIQRTARRLAILRALGLTLAVSLLAALLVMTIDYLVRLEHPMARGALTAIWLVCTGYACWRWPYSLLRTPWSDATVARMVERSFPQLRDRLTSALEFLSQPPGDTASGSRQLMRDVIQETQSTIAELPLNEALDQLPTRRAITLCAGLLLLCLLLGVARGSLASQALTRLISPWRANPWPRVHHLQFVELPLRVATGSDVTLKVIDEHGRLPAQVDFLLRPVDRPDATASVTPMTRDGDVATVVRPRVREAFRFRARGGDDDTMAWQFLDVVPPVRLITSSTYVQPPAYTGWLPHNLAGPPRALRILEGTRISISGVTDRSLISAQLEITSPAETASAAQTAIFSAPASGTRFRVPRDSDTWNVTTPATYRLTFQATDGTDSVDAERWNVQVIRDAVPTLTLLQPDDELLITSQAIIALQCEAQDDLAIERVDLHFQPPGKAADEITINLYHAIPPRDVAMPKDLPAAVDRRIINYEWSVAAWNLPENAVVPFYVSITDFKQQTHQTAVRQWTVVSETELVDRVGRRHTRVLEQLKQLLQQQHAAKSQISLVRSSLETTGEPSENTMDRLQSAVFTQRQVNDSLGGDRGTLLRELQTLGDILARSQLGDDEVANGIAATRQRLTQVVQSHLEPALRDATSALQALQALRAERGGEQSDPMANPSLALSADVPASLQASSEHQERAVVAMQQLLEEMSLWDSHHRFAGELAEFLRQQSQLRLETRDMAVQVLGEAASLPDYQLALGAKASTGQFDLARRLEGTLDRIEQSRKATENADPRAAERLRRVGTIAEQNAISGTIRAAGRHLQQQQFGLAGEQQSVAERVLQQLLETLAHHGPALPEHARRLRAAHDQLQHVRTEQRHLVEAFERAVSRETSETPSGLATRQEEVSTEANGLSQAVDRLRARGAATLLENAAQSARRAAQAVRSGDRKAARDQAAETQTQLEFANDRLRDTLAATLTARRQEQLRRLPSWVDTMLTRQMAIVDQLALVLMEVSPSPGSLQGAIANQEAIAAATSNMISQLHELPVVAEALRSAEDAMREVIHALASPTDSQAAPSPANAAVAMLSQLQRVLREQDAPPAAHDSGATGDSGGMRPPPSEPGVQRDAPDLASILVQLRLLRTLQQNLQTETERLEQWGDASPLRSESAFARLADRQGTLEALLSELGRQLEGAPQAHVPHGSGDSSPQ